MVRESQKTKKTKGVPDHVDKHVGKRLRVRRSLLGISQEKLAEAVGVTFQQIQKYERGTNRVSASRLLKFSQILSVPVDYFYEHLEEIGGSAGENMYAAAGMSDHKQDSFDPATEKLNEKNLMEQKETLELIRVYYSVKDPKSRKDIMKILKTMAQNIS